jgi:two-component system response regulator
MIRSRVILLVEDNDDDIELTIRAFDKTRLANELVVARDGEEALDFLFAQGAHASRVAQRMPELVLLDLKLPGIDGHDVLRAVRADPRTQRLPVVVMTSSAEPDDIGRSYDLGANSFVRKPVDFAEFLNAAQKLASYWLGLNESPMGS